jgi:glutaredoxin
MMRKGDTGAFSGLAEGLEMAAFDANASAKSKPLGGQSVVLYTRQGCHLCDEARDVLAQHGLTPQCVDIDANELLREKFDTCVPVVEIDGRVRFRGRVDPILLRRILYHRTG